MSIYIAMYATLFVMALGLEWSTKCNTDNLLKKAGLGFIMVGCIIHIANKQNPLIEIGVILFFLVEAYRSYKMRSRIGDKYVQKSA